MAYKTLMDYDVDCDFDNITLDIEENIKIIRISFFKDNHFVEDIHLNYGEVKDGKEKSGRV